MRKLSNELIKNYLILILLAAGALIGINIAIRYYLRQEVIRDIVEAREFMVEELVQEDHQNLKKFFNDSILESPGVQNLHINLRSKDIVFKDNTSLIFNWNKSKEKIYREKNFLILNTKFKLLNSDLIDIQIVRNISVELNFSDIVQDFSIAFLIIFVIISFIIQRFFYKNIIKQFDNIKLLTSKVNIGNLDVTFKKDEFLAEFSIIFDAYEKMMARLEKQVNSQMEFVQNASHELRTPIQVISGYTNLIDRWGIENEEVLSDSLTSIKSEVKNISTLIEKLMFLAKQEYIILEKEKFSIKEIIEDINYEMGIIYPDCKLTSTGNEIYLLSDVDLFKQLIRNVTKNAIVYSNFGEVNTEFYVQKSKITIKIQDNGVGMKQDQLDKIFEKFYRVDKSRARSSGGHGLGLAIVKTILELLKGKIRIESEPGKGTTVIIIFDYQEE